MDDKYLEKRRKVEEVFKPENKISKTGSVIVSLSGNFQLEVNLYSTGPKSWNYSRGIVTRLSNNEIIGDVKRNYGAFWHSWVEHPNGHEYLLCGEDYQGYSILNLNTKNYQTYFPEAGHRGAGFCWAFVFPSPDKLVLAVDGCYWACPYELVMYDFRNPEELPFKEILRVESLSDSSGWLDNDTFAFDREVEFRKSDGVPYDELTEEEQDILDNDSTLSDYRYENNTLQETRPFKTMPNKAFSETHP